MHWAPEHLDDGEWFHGSPLRLAALAAGSTVTRCRPVAEAFSHRPTRVGVDDDARPVRVSHDGELDGYLYVIDEPVTEADLHPHPRSSLPGGGLEWITHRPLRLRMVSQLSEERGGA